MQNSDFHPFFCASILLHSLAPLTQYSQKKSSFLTLSRKRANLGGTGITMSLALTEKQLNSLDQSAQIERQLTALINTSLAQGNFSSFISLKLNQFLILIISD